MPNGNQTNRVRISIGGVEYTIVASESKAYMEKVGKYVDDEMGKLLRSGKMGRADAAVMAAVNITDALFKEQTTTSDLRVKLKQALDDAGKAEGEISELKREVFRLQQQLNKGKK